MSRYICPVCLARGVRPKPNVKPYRGIMPAPIAQEATS